MPACTNVQRKREIRVRGFVDLSCPASAPGAVIGTARHAVPPALGQELAQDDGAAATSVERHRRQQALGLAICHRVLI